MTLIAFCESSHAVAWPCDCDGMCPPPTPVARPTAGSWELPKSEEKMGVGGDAGSSWPNIMVTNV